MRILYAAMKYDYGRPEQGFGFEHYNFYDSLREMGHDIVYFDYMTLLQRYGRRQMNQRLLEISQAEKPDLMIAILFKDELDPHVLRELKTHIPTMNWFCDDHWRFDTYSCQWAPCFTWVVTTAESALPKYAALGYRHVIKSQWACNHSLYRKLDLPFQYDLTFVGQPHGNRRLTIQALRNAGINVHVWGRGWESGRISQDEMIRVFNQSRINLNLANASRPVDAPAVPVTGLAVASGSTMRARISRSLDRIPFGSHVKALGKTLCQSSGSVVSVSDDSVACQNAHASYSEQIKGRNFEVPGCGGFMLTERADNLDQYYENGKEVVFFDGRDDLIKKVRYYLTHESERAAIAQAGYERTMRDHTYALRFKDIFRQMGCGEVDDVNSRRGVTQEVT